MTIDGISVQDNGNKGTSLRSNIPKESSRALTQKKLVILIFIVVRVRGKNPLGLPIAQSQLLFTGSIMEKEKKTPTMGLMSSFSQIIPKALM